MTISVGTLLIEMSANVARLQEDMNQATKTVDNAAKQIAKSWEQVKTAFEAVIGFEFARKVIDEGAQAEQAANRLTVAFKLQGDQVGFTRHQLDDMADSLAAATQFKDNDIKRGEAELLKFGNIYGDVFTRAMSLSADLAAFNGTDLVSAIDAIGKSLANPTQGVKGLGAAIGKLLPDQVAHIRNLVEENRGLEAQNYVLDLVQKKIGGTADIMNTGYTKAIADVTKGWDKMLESLAGISIIKDTVVSALEAIAGALRGVASVFGGGSFSEGVLGKQTALAKQITDLQDQIAVEKSRNGLMFTDDEGRVMSEELRIDDLIEKLKKLQEEYDKLYGQKPAAKPGKVKLGMTLEQEAFIKALNHQIDAVGQGPEGALFAKAKELHLGSSGLTSPFTDTEQKIVKLSQALQELNDEKARGERRAQGGKAELGFDENVQKQIEQIKLEGVFIGSTADEQKKWTALQQFDNEVRAVSLKMLPDQAEAFQVLADIMRNDVIRAYDELFAQQHTFTSGFREGFIDVYQAASDSAAQAKTLVVNSFKSMEDALVGFVKTGKLDFRSFADTVVTELIRIQVAQSVTKPLSAALNSSSGALGNLFGSFFSGGSYSSSGSTAATFNSSMYVQPRAAGGDVAANQPYWVGENGPELFMPNTGGTIVPNGAGGAVQVGSINIGQGASPESVQEAFRQLRDLRASVGPIAIGAVAQARQRGQAGLR